MWRGDDRSETRPGWTHQEAWVGSDVRTGSPRQKVAGGIGAGPGQPKPRGRPAGVKTQGVEAAGKGLAAWTYRPEEAHARVERAWT